jgi:hypothetical protein
MHKFAIMGRFLLRLLGISLITIIITPSCMTLDGGNGYRKKNKCCGVIKCDMHRNAQKRKHKHAVTAHKSLKKKERKIKRGY